jgi:hypothetical protein
LTDRSAFKFTVKQAKKIILKQILNKCDREAWTGLMWVRIGASGSHESSGCIKWGKFLEYMRNYWHLEKDVAAWSYLVWVVDWLVRALFI